VRLGCILQEVKEMEALSRADASIAVPQTQIHIKTLETQMLSGLLLGPLAGIVVWFWPLGLDPSAQKALAIVTFMIVYWITEPIDSAITALIGCYLFWALNVAKMSVAFSGFTTNAPWFVFGCLLIGEAVTQTGVVKRLGYFIMLRVGTSYARILLGLIAVSLLLTFLIPSALVRVAMIAPVAAGIIGAYGLGKQSNVAKGLFLIITYSSPLFGKMLMSNPAANLTRGIVEEQTGLQIFWCQWLFAFLPVILVVICALWLLVRWLYPAEVSDLPCGKEYLKNALREMGPLNGTDKRALLWVLLATALWATDSIHHINPAIIALGIGLLLCFPKIGVLDEQAVKRANFMIVLLPAAALSMGNVLIETNALQALTENLAEWMKPMLSHSLNSVITLYWSGFLYHLVLSNDQSMVGTSLPVLVHIAQAQGYNPAVLGLIWTFAGGAHLFVYQSGALVVGYSYGFFSAKDLFKVALAVTVLKGLLLMVVVPLYWPLIGLNWIK
jgi:anion transporter